MPDRTAMLTALAASPLLAIEPRYLGHMLAVIEGRTAARPVRSPLIQGRPVQGTTIVDRVGVVPVMGPMMRHADPFAEFFGAVSIDGIRASVRALLDSPDVDSLLFVVDSPGGDVEGCTDLAAELYAARGTKPMKTVGDGGIYSAAYWVFSGADTVDLPVDGGAGSIGVLAIHFDQSEMLEKIGVKPRIFKSGDKKAALSPFGPLSDEAAREIQADVDAHAARFHKTVAKARGLDVATIKGFEAGVFSAPAAVGAGLADQITTLDAAYLALKRATTASTPGRRTAAQKEPVMPDPEKPAASGSNVVDFEAEKARLRDEVKREEKSRVNAIGGLCTTAGFPELAADMVARDLTIDAAKGELDTCEGIRDASRHLSAEQTKALIGQVASGLTLREACRKISALRAAEAGPEISGRHGPASAKGDAEQPTPLTPIADVYTRWREQAATAHTRRYGGLRQ